MDGFYNKHYITVDGQGRIVDGFSDAFRAPTDADVCINGRGGYQFRLFPGGEENPALFDFEHGVPLYAYEEGAVRARTQEEIGADIADIPPPAAVPTAQDDTDAMLIDHEYRIALLELGLNE